MFPVQSVKPMTVPLSFGASRNGPFASGRYLRIGSISTELNYPDDVRFTPDSDQTVDISDRQLSSTAEDALMGGEISGRADIRVEARWETSN